MLAMSAAGHSTWRHGGTYVAGIHHAQAPYCYRCPFGQTYPECGVKCAQDVEDVIQTVTDGKIAAFIAEPILGVGGFIVPPKEYFGIVKEITARYCASSSPTKCRPAGAARRQWSGSAP